MYSRFGRSFLWGLAGFAGSLVALPAAIILLILVGAIAIAILAITIIGIPVAILLLIALILGIVGLVLGLVIAVFLGFLNGAMFLGQRVRADLGRGKKPLLAITVGVLLITALKVAKLIGLVGLIVFHPIAIARDRDKARRRSSRSPELSHSPDALRADPMARSAERGVVAAVAPVACGGSGRRAGCCHRIAMSGAPSAVRPPRPRPLRPWKGHVGRALGASPGPTSFRGRRGRESRRRGPSPFAVRSPNPDRLTARPSE
jgi:hypothetical protein